ncbi:hypothetical protein AZH53_03050 [Methanomicrobiaceae archaeon CYW5]|nr:hypothetical protein [Methanovulcanius yangii]
MNILVLDTIHGGKEIARHLFSLGHTVDCVDVYRGRDGIPVAEARSRRYDLIAAPVHLDPDHPLMTIEGTPYTTHHEIVATILRPLGLGTVIEITGTRGKTTTAHAIAHGMGGSGILHTSTGTYRYPGKETLWKKSITPASLINAAEEAASTGGWLIAEESIGVSGAGDLGILTSDIDYAIAGGKKSALAEKTRMLAGCGQVLLAPGMEEEIPGATPAGEIVSLEGIRCSWNCNGRDGSFENPLFAVEGYRVPLMTAAAALCLLGEDPAALATFTALPARMHVQAAEGDTTIVDNANSGACLATTCDAVALARRHRPGCRLTLVVGAESSTVCEGFPFADIAEVIKNTTPTSVIIVGEQYRSCRTDTLAVMPLAIVATLDEGAALARSTETDAIVLAVKTWR